MTAEQPKMVRVKVTLPALPLADKVSVPGWLASVTDADTGAYLPVSDLTIEVPASGNITVTGTLLVSEFALTDGQDVP